MQKNDETSTRINPALTRRNLLKATGTGLLGLQAGLAGAAAAPGKKKSVSSASKAASGAKAAAQPAPAIIPLNRYPRMVQEYFIDQVRRVEETGAKVREALRTRKDAERYVESVRAKILESFGPLPEKTPLEARVTGVVERDAYKVEKVVFQSRPGLWVTSNLYIPKGRKFPRPGVVGTCGHSDNGKVNSAYQSFAQGLARLGYVVLIFDPIGQGERIQYLADGGKSRIGVGVREHLLMGNQQCLVGDFLGTWFAWDGIRALDYLLTREEVDPKHVGVTGNSGGGTQTTWLCGLERRWTMGAPSCFVTTFRHNMENELPADTEQCPPRALALGLDHHDWLAAMAPNPVIVLGKEGDFFDVRGTREAFARLKKLYGLLGAEDKVGFFAGPGEHGYTQDNREAMYRWFNRACGMEEPAAEPTLTLEEDQTLWCTKSGNVAELASKTVMSFTKSRAEELAKGRRPLKGEALERAVAGALKLPAREGDPYFTILRPVSRKYPKSTATYAVETEPGIQALVRLLGAPSSVAQPKHNESRAVLYIAHDSSDAEIRDEPLVAELLKNEPDSIFYACDVRGIGESRPNTCGQDTYLDAYGCDYFYAVHSLMLDRPYVGQRTHDVLRVLDWLKGFGHKEVHLAANGWGTLPAVFAAMLSPQVAQVTLKGAPESYQKLAETEDYGWPLSSLLPGVLKTFDLPDCYRALEAKKLKLV